MINHKLIPLEEAEQIKAVQYLELLTLRGNKIKYSSIPNSTYSKSWSVKNRNKEQGLRAGLPDLFILINGDAVWVEMKRTKGGVVSTAQKEWIQALKESDQRVYVCYGFEEFKMVIDGYKMIV